MKSKSFSRILSVGLLTSVGFWLSSCGEDSEKNGENNNSGTSFAEIYSASLINNCEQCHVPDANPATAEISFDVTSVDTAYATLVGVMSKTPSNSACRNIPLVKAGAPEESYLSAILVKDRYGTDGFAGKADCLPAHEGVIPGLSPKYLTEAEVAKIDQWIKAGAAK